MIFRSTEYSRMRWIQVMIFQWSDSVELNVNDEICQITEERILSSNFIKKFEIIGDPNGNLLQFFILKFFLINLKFQINTK